MTAYETLKQEVLHLKEDLLECCGFDNHGRCVAARNSSDTSVKNCCHSCSNNTSKGCSTFNIFCSTFYCSYLRHNVLTKAEMQRIEEIHSKVTKLTDTIHYWATEEEIIDMLRRKGKITLDQALNILKRAA